jgi:hypothetical protein
MIVGMFSIDSYIVEVLFDTGATHSFIHYYIMGRST